MAVKASQEGLARIDNLGEYRQTLDYYQQQQAIAREIGDRRGEGYALSGLGMARQNLGEYRQALDSYQQRLAIARELGDRPGEIAALGNLGLTYNNLGEDRHAIEYYQLALDVSQAIGNPQEQGKILANLGLTYVRLGEYQPAIDALQQCLAIARASNDCLTHADTLLTAGYVYESFTDWEQARLYYRDALRLYAHLGHPSGIAKSRARLGGVLVSQGYLSKGAIELQKAIHDYNQLGQPEKAAEVERFYQVARRALERQESEVYT